MSLGAQTSGRTAHLRFPYVGLVRDVRQYFEMARISGCENMIIIQDCAPSVIRTRDLLLSRHPGPSAVLTCETRVSGERNSQRQSFSKRSCQLALAVS